MTHSSFTYSLLEALPQAVVVLNESGEVQFVNLPAEEIFNQSRKKIIGQHWQKLAEDATLWLLIRTSALEHKRAMLAHHFLSLVGHKPIRTNISISPLMDAAFPDAVVLTFERIERSDEWAEEDIKHEINRSAGVMAAMLAHEVNNPLSGIRGAAQLLGDEVQGENKALATLICNEVDRIRGVLDRVELFADASELPKQHVNIHEAIRHAKQVAEHGFARGIDFIEQYDPSLPEVLAGRDGIIHILINLFKNASEALIDVEHPTITIKTHMLHGVYLRPKKGGANKNAVVVDVMDNGKGIPSELRADIFKPYMSSSSEQGRGLGLAICQKLAGDMGGKLEFVDGQDGACFRLLLEVAKG